MARAYVGTSGWHYKHWRARFFPADLPPPRWLPFYAERFASVEVNNSFYHLLPAAAVEAWVRATPADFTFAVKGSRFITHNKKLKDPQEALARFFAPLRGLGKKLGPIVFQLPPRWRVNPTRLGDFLRALPKRRRYAFEFRHPSWRTEEIYALLRRHNAAFCIYELAGVRTEHLVTADFVYVRLHGPTDQKYQGEYTARELGVWLRRIRAWLKAGKDVYVYFDNDQDAYAAHNALALSRRLERPARRRPSGESKRKARG